MYCELADLDEWVVLNESVMMADCHGGRFSVSKLSVMMMMMMLANDDDDAS